jgi:hypothetical protein
LRQTLGQNVRQSGATPNDIANASLRHEGLQRTAGALMDGLDLDFWISNEVVKAQRERVLDETVNRQLPGLTVQSWNAEVAENDGILCARAAVQ